MPFLIVCLLLTFPVVDAPDLTAQLREYFSSQSPEAQAALRKEITKRPGLTCKTLAKELRSLQLWSAQEPGEREMSIPVSADGKVEKTVWISVPPGYNPAKPWPLLIVLHGQDGKAQPMIAHARRMLGSRADRFIIAAPQDLGPIGFTDPLSVSNQPRELLRQLRRRFHIDSERVFFTGYSLGGHNTWMAGVMHADCFAGILPLATPLRLFVGGDLIMSELLPNVQDTAVLFCWGEQDTLDANGKPRPDGGNAGLSRIMAKILAEQGMKHLRTVEIKGAGHGGVAPDPGDAALLFDYKRERFPKRVHQLFHFAEQSHAYWVEAEALSGPPLPNEEIHFRVKPGEDPITVQRQALLDRLGLIEATCSGQKIEVTSHKTTRVILLLSDELLDLDKPVTIYRNKRRLYSGPIERDPEVMLTEAAREWDFDRLYSARVVLPVGGKPAFGYPAVKKSAKPTKR